MFRKIGLWFLLLIISGLIFATQIKAFDVPNYDGFVNDYAQILSPELEKQLEDELQTTAEASDGAEIAVVTITNLSGDTVENVAQEFFNTWDIGKKHLDNGVLLLVAVEDRKLRIQTGYGAEPIITDAEAGRIIKNVITPKFKKGDYEGGIRQGVAAIQQQFVDSPGFAPGIDPINKNPNLLNSLSETIGAIVVSIIAMVAITYFSSWLGRSKSWWPGGLVGLGLGILISSIALGIFFGLFGLILDYILSSNYKTLKKNKKSTTWKNSWGGFSSGSSSSSSSSSSFSSGSSFGGGSSGGGGASGSW